MQESRKRTNRFDSAEKFQMAVQSEFELASPLVLLVGGKKPLGAVPEKQCPILTQYLSASNPVATGKSDIRKLWAAYSRFRAE